MVTAYGGHVPVFERFFAGGFSSLRGFEFEGVSPVDGPTGQAVGGDALLVGSLEDSVPVSPGDSLWWLTFVDAGYVTGDVEDVLTGWDELRASLGIGIRWRVPLLGWAPVEVDVAVPICSSRATRLRSCSSPSGPRGRSDGCASATVRLECRFRPPERNPA